MVYWRYKDNEPNVGSTLQYQTRSEPLDERKKTRGEANSSEGGVHGPAVIGLTARHIIYSSQARWR